MPKTLTLKATSIVVLDNKNGTHTFVCFRFKEKSLKDAEAANGFQDESIKIELEDENGTFVNEQKYWLTEVRVPNRGNTLGGRDNVMIIEAEVSST